MSTLTRSSAHENRALRIFGAPRASLQETLGAVISDPTLRPTQLLHRQLNQTLADGPELSIEELETRYGDLGLEFDEPMPVAEAEMLAQGKREEIAAQDIIARGPQGFLPGVAKFGAMMVGSAIDPLNIAVSFIPVFGQARWLALAARIGKPGAIFTRGFAQGAIGNAALEPLVYTLSKQQQLDYTFADALVNVAVGGLLGGTFHVGGHAIRHGFARLRPETRETAIRTAVAQIARGKSVNVEPVIRADRARVAQEPRATAPIPPFENIQRTLAIIKDGKAFTDQELQRLLSPEEFSTFKSRTAQIREEAREIPEKTEAAETYINVAERARSAQKEARTPKQLEHARKIRSKARELFARLPEKEQATFIKVAGDPLPQPRRQLITNKQVRTQAAIETLEVALERRFQEPATITAENLRDIAAKEHAVERDGIYDTSELAAQRAEAKEVLPTPDEEIALAQAEIQTLQRAGRLSEEEVASLAELDEFVEATKEFVETVRILSDCARSR